MDQTTGKGFILFHPKDLEWYDRLLRHLRGGRIEWQSESSIEPGRQRDSEIQRMIEESKIVLMLASADLLADSMRRAQLDFAAQRAALGLCVLVPIKLRPVDFADTPFNGRQLLPRNGRFISSLPRDMQDEAFTAIAIELERVVDDFASHRPFAQESPIDFGEDQSLLQVLNIPNGAQIFVTKVEPWTLPVDAMVLPTGSRAELAGQLPRALDLATGARKKIKGKISLHLDSTGGILRPGEPFLIDRMEGYKPPGPKRYFIVATAFDDKEHPSTALVTHATRAVVKLAYEQKVTSLSFPLLGAGSGGLPAGEVLQATLSALREVLPKYPIHTIILITLEKKALQLAAQLASQGTKGDLSSGYEIDEASHPTLVRSPPEVRTPSDLVFSSAPMLEPKASPKKAEPKAPPKMPPQEQPTGDLWLRIHGDRRVLFWAGQEASPLWTGMGAAPDWRGTTFGDGEKRPLELVKRDLPLWRDEEVRAFGRELARLLFGDTIYPKVVKALQVPDGESRRLVLDLDRPSAALPWEYLFVDKGFLLEQRLSLVRHIKANKPRGVKLQAPSGTLLFAYATVGGNYDAEDHQQRILRATTSIGLTITPVPRCTADALTRALEPGAYGFHFLGHGDEKGRLIVHGADRTQEDWLPGDIIATWMKKGPGFGFVFLGACHSGAVPMRGDDFSGVALPIAEATGTPVVAMQFDVPQEFSSEFAARFYEELKTSGFDLEHAVYRARAFKYKERCDFAIPVLVADFSDTPRLTALPDPPRAAFNLTVTLGGVADWRPVLEKLATDARAPLQKVMEQLPEGAQMPRPDPTDLLASAHALLDFIRATRTAESSEAIDVARRALEPSRVDLEPGTGDTSVSPRVGHDPPFSFDWADWVNGRFRTLCERYSFDDGLIQRVVAELRAGRHVMLTGPVGTGKTTLAREIINALGYDAHVETASADWTNHEVVGGHWPQAGGQLEFVFRPGAFVSAVLKNWQEAMTLTKSPGAPVWSRPRDGVWRGTWLLIDELNRADMDRAFGGLFTALESRSLRVPVGSYKRGSATTSLVPIPRDFRVLCTINGADRHYLFRLSDALKRRFAFVEVPVTTDWKGEWQRLLQDAQTGEDGFHATIDDDNMTLLSDLRRLVYLVRLFQPLGTAQLRAGLRFLLASAGSPLSPALRLSQAVEGSVLPSLEDAEESTLRALHAWADAPKPGAFSKETPGELPASITRSLSMCGLPGSDGSDVSAAANDPARLLLRCGGPDALPLMGTLERLLRERATLREVFNVRPPG